MGETPFDYVILGAGPGGLQLAYYLERRNADYVVLERDGQAGTFFDRFPRHRQLISVNKVHTGSTDPEFNLRMDWNSLLSASGPLFPEYTKRYWPPAEDLVRYLNDFAERYSLAVRYGVNIVRISRDEDGFLVAAADGRTFRAGKLVVATGLTKPYVPDIVGIEHAEPYTDFPIDPEEYADQRILIIGKGNSAFETAESLAEVASTIHLCSPNPIKMAWKSHFVGHLRAINNNVLDTYQLKLQNAILDAHVTRIEPRDLGYVVSIVYSHAKGERRDIPYDRILYCTGFRFDASIFDESCRPALSFDGRLPSQTALWESRNVRGLFFAGTLMQMRDYKKTMSGFIHGFRYNILALDRILHRKEDATWEWPFTSLPSETDVVADTVLERVNRSSALFLQPGFLCDVMVHDENGGFRYYEDMPIDYVHETDFAGDKPFFQLTLEYGDFESKADPFDFERDPDPNSQVSEFLHPVLRLYRGARLLSQLHVLEDLENVFVGEQFSVPVRNYLGAELDRRQGRVLEGAQVPA